MNAHIQEPIMSFPFAHLIPVRRLARIFMIATLLGMTAAPAFSGDMPFLGDVVCYAFTYCPRGWARCDGQLLPINQNQALFALLGTQFGGDGRVTFALPDLRGRSIMHQGASLSYAASVGASGGSDRTSLTTANLPPHTHQVTAFPREGSTGSPGGAVWAKSGDGTPTYAAKTDTAMNPAAVTVSGGSASYDAMPPYLVTTCCIALVGVFPSRN
jgi:microcystin-dependent protein